MKSSSIPKSDELNIPPLSSNGKKPASEEFIHPPLPPSEKKSESEKFNIPSLPPSEKKSESKELNVPKIVIPPLPTWSVRFVFRPNLPKLLAKVEIEEKHIDHFNRQISTSMYPDNYYSTFARVWKVLDNAGKNNLAIEKNFISMIENPNIKSTTGCFGLTVERLSNKNLLNQEILESLLKRNEKQMEEIDDELSTKIRNPLFNGEDLDTIIENAIKNNPATEEPKPHVDDVLSMRAGDSPTQKNFDTILKNVINIQEVEEPEQRRKKIKF